MLPEAEIDWFALARLATVEAALKVADALSTDVDRFLVARQPLAEFLIDGANLGEKQGLAAESRVPVQGVEEFGAKLGPTAGPPGTPADAG
jgi:hypothetical protein